MVLPDTVVSPSVQLALPPASLFHFPPSPHPAVVIPPPSDGSIWRPFSINPTLYNALLSVNYPVSIALLYATTVVILGRVNKARSYKPWAFSKTTGFWLFVVAHNLLLAIYSAWTCAGMIHVMIASMPAWSDGAGLVGVVDVLCHINGPRGLGNAINYNQTTSMWSVGTQTIKLLGGNPDNTDVGRIWNEGLAFYGWLFYLSKYYEVIDTAIILAKGKKSSLLQTYHHTGAMLCMWAGIRYMSPPIWMFVLVNAGIHAMMYTYYAFSALGFKTPMLIKRSLTTCQITQFLVGAPYALSHLFIRYKVPISVPYLVRHGISTAIPAMASTASSVVSSVGAQASIGNWVKKIALRAAGEEGLAENVRNAQGSAFGIDAIHHEQAEHLREQTTYRLEDHYVHCTDTDGQAFAILLNVMYLLPLTYLFMSFFIQSYIKRTSSTAKPASRDHAISKASADALKGVEREIRESLAQQGIFSDLDFSDVDLPADAKQLLDAVQGLKASGKELSKQGLERVREESKRLAGKAKGMVGGKENVKMGSQHITGDDAGDNGLRKAGDGNEPRKAKATKGPAGDAAKPEQKDEKDAKAYEANVDEAMTSTEKEAQKKMQPAA